MLVDQDDLEIGVMEKLQAHREGLRHRAVSVFIRDSSGHYLLQQRAAAKYHGARLWSNTACGHPRPNESPHAAASRRLLDEMGLSCPLIELGSISYRLAVGELIEHEIDHVFIGEAAGEPQPDPREVMAWRTSPLDDLETDLQDRPDRYSPWLPFVLQVLRASQARR